jgi:hypothetical protein
MRSLWADERFVDENTLTVNITRIRKKITDLGKESFIFYILKKTHKMIYPYPFLVVMNPSLPRSVMTSVRKDSLLLRKGMGISFYEFFSIYKR